MTRKHDDTKEQRHPLLEALDDCGTLRGRINGLRRKISVMQESKNQEVYSYANLELLHLDNYVRRVGGKLKDYIIKEGIE